MFGHSSEDSTDAAAATAAHTLLIVRTLVLKTVETMQETRYFPRVFRNSNGATGTTRICIHLSKNWSLPKRLPSSLGLVLKFRAARAVEASRHWLLCSTQACRHNGGTVE